MKFFAERERWARQLGYTSAAFCAVIRDENDLLKPNDHVALDRFWQNRGYHKKEGYICKLSWKQVNETQESEKKLQFWFKEL